MASFDADARPPEPSPDQAPAAGSETTAVPVPPRIRLEASSLRSLEDRRNRWIRARLERERRATPAAPAVTEP